MIERLSFSRDSEGNVRYSLTGPDGEIIATGGVSSEEWDALRAKVIEHYPAENGFDIIDYIVALCELVE